MLDTVVNPDPGFWHGRTVLVTGHTGFKGGWLCHWLLGMGAEVYGMALSPDPDVPEAAFRALDLETRLTSSIFMDIRDHEQVADILNRIRPSVIFHLAAQSLVGKSYQDPLGTLAVNVMGTAHLLDALAGQGRPCTVINVTSDKCYENTNEGRPFIETDPLGGHDLYAASKACSEIIARAYSRSFLSECGIGLANVRAGNVIGGGDWAHDRLLPDIVRASWSEAALALRNPEAVRPWQHVLEPLSGYLILAERLSADPGTFGGGWNFGPPPQNAVSVSTLLELVNDYESAPERVLATDPSYAEAKLLRLDTKKARSQLQWRPHWALPDCIHHTLAWYAAARSGDNMQRLSTQQIDQYLTEKPLT